MSTTTPCALPRSADDDVRRLARDAGQPEQVVEPRRHLAAVVLDQDAHRAAQRLGLLPEEAGGEDVALELLDRHREVVLGSAVLDEEILRDAVDVHVRRLRREHHGDEQLERAAERQRDRRVGVLDGEPLDDRPHARPLRPDPPPGLVDVAPRHPRDGSAPPLGAPA